MVSTKPNILFIFTDQFRADCIGALGNAQIRTPNIDRLAREGTTFTKCYSPSPVCVPARHALTSGQPPHKTGCVDNIYIDCERPSFMHQLNDLGYQTHGIGKMHFSKCKGDWGFQSREYAEELVGECFRDDYREFVAANGYTHVIDPYGFRSEFYYLPQPSQLPERLHSNTWVADRSIDFLSRRDSAKPFFLWSSFVKPHPPFESPVPWSRLYRLHEMDGPYMPEECKDQQNFWSFVQARYKYMDSGDCSHLARMIRAAYYSTISHIDFHVGRILDSLGSEIDNTLIVFSSDHGEMLGDYGCYGKRSMLDPSARVPMIARLPGAFEQGDRCGTPSTLLDLFPTFIEIAGGPIDNTLEGVSLQRLLEDDFDDRAVYSQFFQNQLGLYMAVTGRFKYIYSAPDNKEWLYKDGCENINLAGDKEHECDLKRMRLLCVNRFQNDDYQLPLNGDHWRQFPPMDYPADRDYGLIFQDPPALDKAISALGPDYAHSDLDKRDEEYHYLRQLAQLSKIPHPALSESGILPQK